MAEHAICGTLVVLFQLNITASLCGTRQRGGRLSNTPTNLCMALYCIDFG